jgi:PKD repeat protein
MTKPAARAAGSPVVIVAATAPVPCDDVGAIADRPPDRARRGRRPLRGWLAVALVALIGLATPSLAAAAPPTASFTVSPESPQLGELVTLTSTSSDPDNDPLTLQWSLSGGSGGGSDSLVGANDVIATATFVATGPRQITLRVTAGGETAEHTETVTVTEPDVPPVASFTIDPPTVRAGAAVTFKSTSTDADGQIAAQAWDLDGDGAFDDSTAATPQWTYTSAGNVAVGLQVTDDRGATSVATGQVVVVPNAPPVAAFSFKPAAPRAGDAVLFTSASTDPDGTIQQLRWDLNGDGRFDDGVGPTAARVFLRPGSHLVALNATDDLGVSSTAFDIVQVADLPSTGLGLATPTLTGTAGLAPLPVTKATSLSRARVALLLSPFPIVRMRGVIQNGAVRVQILSVHANRGARVEVACIGRSCPVRRVVRPVRSGRRVVRFAMFERRLRAGLVIEVRVTQPGRIGKYTRFRLRSNAPPTRRDGCIRFGARSPSACPLQ